MGNEIIISWVQVSIAVVGFLASGIIAILRVGYLLGQFEKNLEGKIRFVSDVLKEDYKSKIDTAVKNGDEKRARIYSRFDEHKAFCDNIFVRRDMCGIVHKNTSDEVATINKRLDGFAEKIDELKNILIGKKNAIS